MPGARRVLDQTVCENLHQGSLKTTDQQTSEDSNDGALGKLYQPAFGASSDHGSKMQETGSKSNDDDDTLNGDFSQQNEEENDEIETPLNMPSWEEVQEEMFKFYSDRGK